MSDSDDDNYERKEEETPKSNKTKERRILPKIMENKFENRK